MASCIPVTSPADARAAPLPRARVRPTALHTPPTACYRAHLPKRALHTASLLRVAPAPLRSRRAQCDSLAPSPDDLFVLHTQCSHPPHTAPSHLSDRGAPRQ